MAFPTNFGFHHTFNIYQANFVLEGVASSNTLSSTTKNQLTGEAKFVRAFCYFYLINLFSDVPLLTTTAWETNSVMPRTSKSKVYEQIITDLKEAKDLLAEDYGVSNNERIRPNKSTAAALLARVYLYTGNYADAEQQSSFVINNTSLYSLTDVKDVFLQIVKSNLAIATILSAKWSIYNAGRSRLYSL